MSDQQASSIGSFPGQFITWLLVVIGWAIVSELQDFRELRKDRVSRLGELRKQLAEIEESVLAFHTAEFDGRAVQQIQTGLSAVGRELSFLDKCRYIEGDYQDQLVDFRQACTEKNFDKSSHSALQHDDPVCLNIMATRAQLDSALIGFQVAATTSGLSPIGVIWRVLKRWWDRGRALWRQVHEWLEVRAQRPRDEDEQW